MPTCPNMDACALGRSITMTAALRVWQSFYCDGCFSRCERYKLASVGLQVPARLLPNGRLQDPLGGEGDEGRAAPGGRAA